MLCNSLSSRATHNSVIYDLLINVPSTSTLLYTQYTCGKNFHWGGYGSWVLGDGMQLGPCEARVKGLHGEKLKQFADIVYRF